MTARVADAAVRRFQEQTEQRFQEQTERFEHNEEYIADLRARADERDKKDELFRSFIREHL